MVLGPAAKRWVSCWRRAETTDRVQMDGRGSSQPEEEQWTEGARVEPSSKNPRKSRGGITETVVVNVTENTDAQFGQMCRLRWLCCIEVMDGGVKLELMGVNETCQDGELPRLQLRCGPPGTPVPPQRKAQLPSPSPQIKLLLCFQDSSRCFNYLCS